VTRVNTFNDYTWRWVKSFSVPQIFLLKLNASEVRHKIVLSLFWLRNFVLLDVNIFFHILPIVKNTLAGSLSFIFFSSHLVIRTPRFGIASVTCTRSLQIIVKWWLINRIWLLNWRVVVPLFFGRPHFNPSIFVKVSTSSSSASFKRFIAIIIWRIVVTILDIFGMDPLDYFFEAWTLFFLGFILDLLTNLHHSVWNSVRHNIRLKFVQIIRHLRELLKRTHLCHWLNLIHLLSWFGEHFFLFRLFHKINIVFLLFFAFIEYRQSFGFFRWEFIL
jgi:hypothetical protein